MLWKYNFKIVKPPSVALTILEQKNQETLHLIKLDTEGKG